MIKFACSHCSKSICVDDKDAGKQGKCPKCGNAIVVPKRLTLIEFACEGCGHTIKVADRYAGKQGKCPKCKKPVLVPAVQKKPVKEKGGPENITCALCGEAISITDDLVDASIECPGCGGGIDASSGSPVPQAEDETSSDTEEDLYEESSGLDRRLVIIATGVVAVVVIVGLVMFLRSPGSGPAQEPIIPNRPAEMAETGSQSQPVVANKPVSESIAAPETGDDSRLQFSPNPGDKQTLRVSTQVNASMAQDGQQQQVISTQIITVGLEVDEKKADGTTGVGVTLTRIQIKTVMGGITAGTYDSAEADSKDNPVAEFYDPFVNKRFAVGVSAQGDIIDPGLDELFLAAAEDRMQAEDDMIREHTKERADVVIERTDQRFGSRQARALDMKKKLEEFPLFGTGKVRELLAHLVVPLPLKSAQVGADWNGSLPIGEGSGIPVTMPGTYTVIAIEEDICTISAQGERDINEAPIVSQNGPATNSSKLEGSSQANLTIDHRTGWLLNKEQTTRLEGETLSSAPGSQGSESAMQVDMEITVTVSPDTD